MSTSNSGAFPKHLFHHFPAVLNILRVHAQHTTSDNGIHTIYEILSVVHGTMVKTTTT
jgi:hypothetical protein